MLRLILKSHSKFCINCNSKIFVLLPSYYQLYLTHNSFVTFYPLTSVACKQLHTIYSITNTNTLINTVNKSTDQLITSFRQSSIVLTISRARCEFLHWFKTPFSTAEMNSIHWNCCPFWWIVQSYNDTYDH